LSSAAISYRIILPYGIERAEFHITTTTATATSSTSNFSPTTITTTSTTATNNNNNNNNSCLLTCWLNSTSGNYKAGTRTQIQHKNNIKYTKTEKQRKTNNNNNNNNNKGEIICVHAMKACKRSRGIAPVILNVDTKWR
jgi:hypothetical protein